MTIDTALPVTRPKRRPHFKRSASPAIRITPDDITMIEHVAQHRFRRSTDLVRLLSHRPPKKIIERLADLYHAGYLDRPDAQRDYFTAQHRPAYIYAVGNHGAKLLHALAGTTPPKVNWKDKNRSCKRPYLQHTLMIGDVATAADRIPLFQPSIRVIPSADLLALRPPGSPAGASPWTWRAKVPAPDGTWHDTKTKPDVVCGLDFTSRRLRYYYFVEADNGTMPILRTDAKNTSIGRKLLAYLTGHRAQQHNQFGFGNLRFVFVARSTQRLSNMRAALLALAGDAPVAMFVFVEHDRLRQAPHLMAAPFVNAHGHRVSLTD